MRAFKHFPDKGMCLLCKTNTDKPCILIGVDGTERNGNEQAECIHVDCMLEGFRYSNLVGLVYRKVEP